MIDQPGGSPLLSYWESAALLRISPTEAFSLLGAKRVPSDKVQALGNLSDSQMTFGLDKLRTAGVFAKPHKSKSSDIAKVGEIAAEIAYAAEAGPRPLLASLVAGMRS